MKSMIRSAAKLFFLLSAALLMIGTAAALFTPSDIVVNRRTSKIIDRSPALTIRCNAENTDSSNSSDAEMVLFGTVPVKEVNLSFGERKNVIVGGTPFGIRIYTDGLMVSQTADVETKDGKKNPSAEAGIQCGDNILSVNGERLKTNEQLLACVENSGGESIRIEGRRGNEKYSVRITPVKDIHQNQYRIGLMVRDSCAGIGTLTFIDPSNNTFGGLGHGICDSESGSLMPLEHGDTVRAAISSVRKGTCGSPGSLSGYFTDNDSFGTLSANCEYGVFGTVADSDRYNENAAVLPAAFKQEVKKGKAQIRSTIDGITPEYYDVEIEEVSYNTSDHFKNMVIKVTDERLLEKTGGIVQGMSGSPVIQNGKLVGAVTHVFVNDPTRGYAVFVETMMSNEKITVQNDSDSAA